MLTEVHSKVSSFWRSSGNPRSDNPEAVHVLSYNLTEETIKCKNGLEFSASKNPMSMSNYCAGDNVNLESLNEN